MGEERRETPRRHSGVENGGRVGERRGRKGGNVGTRLVSLFESTHTQTHTRARTRAGTDTHAHTRTHAHTHTRTRTHGEKQRELQSALGRERREKEKRRFEACQSPRGDDRQQRCRSTAQGTAIGQAALVRENAKARQQGREGETSEIRSHLHSLSLFSSLSLSLSPFLSSLPQRVWLSAAPAALCVSSPPPLLLLLLLRLEALKEVRVDRHPGQPPFRGGGESGRRRRRLSRSGRGLGRERGEGEREKERRGRGSAGQTGKTVNETASPTPLLLIPYGCISLSCPSPSNEERVTSGPTSLQERDAAGFDTQI